MSDLLERLASALGDRYEVERELGSGGMATVYLARDLRNQRHVAIKVLRQDLASVIGGERFLREIEMVAQIEHPHILTLIDSGDAAGFLYYVMPYVKGESLRDRLSREGKLPVRDAVRMLRDVADGLAEAHRHGLVHRDIKPGNVMISGNHAVVTDFGVAKAVSSATGEQKMTSAGIALGTPSYMAPEQVTADPNVDHRADIYALGAMGFELLAGRPPFLGATTQEVMAAHITATPEPLSEHRPETPPALEAILERCLEKRPDDRWQTTEEVLGRLEAIATPSGGVPSLHVSAIKAPKGTHWLNRRTLTMGAVLVVAALAVAVQQRSAARTQAFVAELQTAVEAGDFDGAYTLLDGSDRTLGDAALAPIAQIAGGWLTIDLEPASATLLLERGLGELDSLSAPRELAEARLLDAPLIAGEYRLRATADGFLPATFTFRVNTGDTLSLVRALVREEWEAEGMVLIDGGAVPGPLAGQFEGVVVPSFLMDRYEVTNEQFLEFVSAGGYRNASLWPDTLLIAGEWVARDPALAGFVDQTGLPGPRSWSGGAFAEGRGDHPVTRVSWYEASAFATWAGKALPTLEQWWRGALGDSSSRFPWGDDVRGIDARSNFGGLGTVPVGQYTFGASPFGVHDIAGNVREWVHGDPSTGRLPVVGGSWQTPTYMFDSPNIEVNSPSFHSEEVGFRLAMPIPGS